MKYHQWTYAVIITLVMLGSLPNGLQAQQWSAAQKAVWSDVNTYWDLFAKGDVDGMLSYFDADYSGWDVNDPLPTGKTSTEKGLKHFLAGNEIVLYNIQPVAINVHDNFAIVHYYYSMTVKNAEGKERFNNGRWTDILLKKGGKWMLIGDHGGRSAN